MAKKTRAIELKDWDTNYCLFCGQKLKVRSIGHYDDETYCDCPDVLENQRLDDEINKLRYKKISPKFAIRKRTLTEMVEIDKWGHEIKN